MEVHADRPNLHAPPPCVDSPRPDRFPVEPQILQNKIDDELNRLRKEFTRIKERKMRLLQLQWLDEEEDRVKMRLDELQYNI